MSEWVVETLGRPTKAMERYKTGEIVRCRDCDTFEREIGRCGRTEREASPMGFCSWGRRKGAGRTDG